MFSRLPEAMLTEGHLHQWGKGLSCSRVLLQLTCLPLPRGLIYVQSGTAGWPAYLLWEFGLGIALAAFVVLWRPPGLAVTLLFTHPVHFGAEQPVLRRR